MVGVRGAKSILAINTDPDAPSSSPPTSASSAIGARWCRCWPPRWSKKALGDDPFARPVRTRRRGDRAPPAGNRSCHCSRCWAQAAARSLAICDRRGRGITRARSLPPGYATRGAMFPMDLVLDVREPAGVTFVSRPSVSAPRFGGVQHSGEQRGRQLSSCQIPRRLGQGRGDARSPKTSRRSPS